VPDLCDVLWLQSTEIFADIRIPRSGVASRSVSGPAGLFYRPWAFAGVTRWNPPSVVWEHALDTDRDPVTDIGILDLSIPGWAFEDGTVVWEGRDVPFREEWKLVSAPGAPVHVLETPERICVTVGSWRIDVAEGRPGGVFRAERLEIRGGTWEVIGRVMVP
jgi:hypothetical protein